jgi:hypothetical protein
MEIVEIGRRIDSPNLAAGLLQRDERYPYAAPGGHYSSFGNRLVAEHYESYLMKGGAAAVLLDFQDLAAEASLPLPESERLPLSSFDRIELHLGGRPAAVLAIASRDPGLRIGSADALFESGTAALLGLYGPSATLVDAGFVPIRHPSALQDDLLVRVRCGEEIREQNLGRPRWIDGRINLASLQIPGLTFSGGGFRYQGEWPAPSTICSPLEVTFLLGSTLLLTGTGQNWRIFLDPPDGTLWNFRVGEGQYVSPADLGSHGEIALALHHSEHGTLTAPFAEWRKRSEAIAQLDRPIAKQLELVGGRVVVSADAREP